MTMTAVSVGPQQYRKDYPAEDFSVRLVRKDVAIVLATWSLQALTWDAEQIVTELMANATEHTGSEQIRAGVIRVSERSVRIEVTDRSSEAPRLVDAGADCEGGRGILLVAGLAVRWGWEPVPGGKKVWAELAD